MAALPKLNWQTVNTDTMPKPLLKAYNDYRTKLEAAEKERHEMEAAIQAHMERTKKIPAGQEVRFAYRWGKMAIAFADPSEARAKGGGEQFTF